MRDLAEDLASYGVNVNVVCAQPTYLIKQKCSAQEIKNAVTIKRVRTFLFNKNKILGRIFNSTSCFVSMLFQIIFSKKNCLYIFNTNPALLPVLGLFGLLIKKQKYVLLLHDLWPELPAHNGFIEKNSILYRTIDSFNTLCFQYACGIVVLSDTMKKTVLQKVPKHKDRIHVIHNWADEGGVHPVGKEDNKLLEDFQVRDKKVVMYSGNLGRYQPLEVMMYAADYLKDRDDIVFFFIGDGAKKKKLMGIARQKGLTNVRFIPFQPMEKLAESLSMADISLIGIMPENEGVIMPSKLYGLLAVGKPILCVSDPDSEVVSILKNAGAGYHASIDDPKDLATKILSLLDDPETMQKMGTSGRKYFLEHFERKKVTSQWKNVLESIIEKEGIGESKTLKQKRIHASFQKARL